MKRLVGFVFVQALILVCSTSGAFADKTTELSVQLFNVDDEIDVFSNGAMVASCGFNQTCWIDLAPFLQVGANSIRFDVKNTVAGYAYGIVLFRNGKPVLNEVCGDIHSSLRNASCSETNEPAGTIRSFQVEFLK